MSPALQLTIIYAEEWLLELRVAASNGVFAGQTEVWENMEATSNLAQSIRRFPTNTTDSREFDLGTFKDGQAGGGVRLWLSCRDSLGHATLKVQLRADPAARPGPVDSAVFSISVEPAALDAFVDQLEAMSGKVGQTASLQRATLHPPPGGGVGYCGGVVVAR